MTDELHEIILSPYHVKSIILGYLANQHGVRFPKGYKIFTMGEEADEEFGCHAIRVPNCHVKTRKSS